MIISDVIVIGRESKNWPVHGQKLRAWLWSPLPLFCATI